jgi:methylase of polypeptide subunit release factors
MEGSLTFNNGIHIEWNPGDDGGGSRHYVDFLNAIGKEKKYNNCLEWCAGLSAIAFSLLDANITEKIVLMDIYEPALLQAQENAKNNNIIDNVSIRLCDKISSLPLTDKFDLVVSNPPHSVSDHWIEELFSHADQYGKDLIYRLTIDKDWELHKEFFKNITKYLSQNADLYISEVNETSWFVDWAKEVGLNLIEIFTSPILSTDSRTTAIIYHFRYEA